MAEKQARLWSGAGWSLRGELQVNGELEGEAGMQSLASWFAPDGPSHWKLAVERPVSAFGVRMQRGWLESEFHTHREAELIYQVKGELVCEGSNALWIVPPHSALWVPASVAHKIKARAPLQGYSVFIQPNSEQAAKLPSECCALEVSPLLRELLISLAERAAPYELDGPEARLVAVLLDELAKAKVEKHRLPIPSDPRLRRLVDEMIANPGDGATLQTWAKRLGVGERTLNRLLVRDTGLSFGRWRQQLHITLALQALSRGASVQGVALELGFESASSFVTMFKKALGTSPARYMARRLEESGLPVARAQ